MLCLTPFHISGPHIAGLISPDPIRISKEKKHASTEAAGLARSRLGNGVVRPAGPFPTSAVHGLRWYQIDISALVISALEKVGLVWDVVRVSPERQARKAASPA